MLFRSEAYYYREGKQNFYADLKANVTSQDTVYQWRRQYVCLLYTSSKLDAFFNDNVNYIKRFTNPEHLEIAADVEVPDLVMSSIITGAEIYLPLADLLNVEEELARLEKELAKWQKELDIDVYKRQDVAMLVESGLLLPFVAIYLIFFSPESFSSYSSMEMFLLAISGVVTAVPLLCFSEAVKRAPLNLIGFIQYLNPTIQLLVAILIFGETVSFGELKGFLFIWIAILVFVTGQIVTLRRSS